MELDLAGGPGMEAGKVVHATVWPLQEYVSSCTDARNRLSGLPRDHVSLTHAVPRFVRFIFGSLNLRTVATLAQLGGPAGISTARNPVGLPQHPTFPYLYVSEESGKDLRGLAKSPVRFHGLRAERPFLAGGCGQKRRGFFVVPPHRRCVGVTGRVGGRIRLGYRWGRGTEPRGEPERRTPVPRSGHRPIEPPSEDRVRNLAPQRARPERRRQIS